MITKSQKPAFTAFVDKPYTDMYTMYRPVAHEYIDILWDYLNRFENVQSPINISSVSFHSQNTFTEYITTTVYTLT